MTSERWDETWFRLLEWTGSSGKAERLAAQVLYASGFTDVDPAHPLGGPDGTHDAKTAYDGAPWIMAVYFPRGQQSFNDIRKKFSDDCAGLETQSAAGIVFVTNQELRLGERKTLRDLVPAGHACRLFHLEYLTGVLDRWQMRHTRLQYLGIDFGADTPGQDAPSQRLAELARGWAPLADLPVWDGGQAASSE